MREGLAGESFASPLLKKILPFLVFFFFFLWGVAILSNSTVIIKCS
jgi:hypothetical protein